MIRVILIFFSLFSLAPLNAQQEIQIKLPKTDSIQVITIDLEGQWFDFIEFDQLLDDGKGAVVEINGIETVVTDENEQIYPIYTKVGQLKISFITKKTPMWVRFYKHEE